MGVCPKQSTGRGPQGKELQHQDCWSSRSIQTTLGDMVCYLGSGVEAEVGLDNPCVSFPAQDVLGFYDSGYKHDDVGVTVLWQWIGAF